MTDSLGIMRELRVVPVVVIDEARDAVPLARALVAGGLPCAEVTLRTPAAIDALRAISAGCPELHLGAGTVLSVEQAIAARRAGAGFIVSPGLNPDVVEHCLAEELPVFPGVCTPTEIEMALRRGLEVVKFFPAEPIGGLRYLKAIAAPYRGLEFMPTGGIGPAQLPAYLGFDRVVACGGSWMVKSDWIRAGEFERVRQAAEEAVSTVRQTTEGREP